MFEIEYKGANAVIISTKKGRLVIDPKLSLVGLKDISCKDAVELLTEERFGINDENTKIIIDSPGEYGVSGFDILGIPARRHIDTDKDGFKSVIYRLEIGDSRIGIIGNIHGKLSDEQLESLGVLDIVIIPVGGGGYTLDAVSAATLIRSISPKIVVPIHYADSAVKYEVPQDALSRFVDELGAPVEVVSKYKPKQPLINQATLQVIEIERS